MKDMNDCTDTEGGIASGTAIGNTKFFALNFLFVPFVVEIF
jgi:hypothetical protein